MLAVLALALQLAAPTLAQAAAHNGWIEICSGAGAVWVQVADDGASDPDNARNKTECRDCAICMLTTAAAMPTAAAPSGPVSTCCVLVVETGRRTQVGHQLHLTMARDPPELTDTRLARIGEAL